MSMNKLASIPWQSLDTRPYTPGMFGDVEPVASRPGYTGPIHGSPIRPGGTPSTGYQPPATSWDPTGGFVPSTGAPTLPASAWGAAPAAPVLGAAPTAAPAGSWATPTLDLAAADRALASQMGVGSSGTQPIVTPQDSPLSDAIQRYAKTPATQATPGMGSAFTAETSPQRRKQPTGQWGYG
jgi:hypothetical protein